MFRRLWLCRSIISKQAGIHLFLPCPSCLALRFQLRIVLLPWSLAADHYLQSQHLRNGPALLGFRIVTLLHGNSLAAQPCRRLLLRRPSPATQGHRRTDVCHHAPRAVRHRQPCRQLFPHLFYIYRQSVRPRRVVAILLCLLTKVLCKRPCRQQCKHPLHGLRALQRHRLLPLTHGNDHRLMLRHQLAELSHPLQLLLGTHVLVKFLCCHNLLLFILNFYAQRYKRCQKVNGHKNPCFDD